MAENKTKQATGSVSTFIGTLGDAGRRVDAEALINLMREASGEDPKMWGPSIIGFGSYHYVYDSGREGDAPLIGFSPRKSATVLYLHLGDGDSVADLAKLGKHTMGKGCLYIKKMADVDRRVVEQIIRKAFAKMRKKHSRD
jgi:hypothetical protein